MEDIRSAPSEIKLRRAVFHACQKFGMREKAMALVLSIGQREQGKKWQYRCSGKPEKWVKGIGPLKKITEVNIYCIDVPSYLYITNFLKWFFFVI